MKKLTDSLLNYGKMVRFSHSIFALPFAFAGALLVHSYHALTLRHILWILAAMVSGRSMAMGLNRILDSDIDRINPRTSQRQIPQGVISKKHAWNF